MSRAHWRQGSLYHYVTMHGRGFLTTQPVDMRGLCNKAPDCHSEASGRTLQVVLCFKLKRKGKPRRKGAVWKQSWYEERVFHMEPDHIGELNTVGSIIQVAEKLSQNIKHGFKK